MLVDEPDVALSGVETFTAGMRSEVDLGINVNRGAVHAAPSSRGMLEGEDARGRPARVARSNRVLVLQHRDEGPTEQLLRVFGERKLEPIVWRVGDKMQAPEPETLRAAVHARRGGTRLHDTITTARDPAAVQSCPVVCSRPSSIRSEQQLRRPALTVHLGAPTDSPSARAAESAHQLGFQVRRGQFVYCAPPSASRTDR
jgi:hypothetical protein